MAIVTNLVELQAQTVHCKHNVQPFVLWIIIIMLKQNACPINSSERRMLMLCVQYWYQPRRPWMRRFIRFHLVSWAAAGTARTFSTPF